MTIHRRTLTALAVVIALAAGAAAWFLWPPATLEDNGGVDRALPSASDFPGYRGQGDGWAWSASRIPRTSTPGSVPTC